MELKSTFTSKKLEYIYYKNSLVIKNVEFANDIKEVITISNTELKDLKDFLNIVIKDYIK